MEYRYIFTKLLQVTCLQTLDMQVNLDKDNSFESKSIYDLSEYKLTKV